MQLHGYVPDAAAIAFRQGAVPSNQQMRLSIVLPLRNQAALASLLHSLYDPKDPLYGHYITPAQFTQQFGPSESDIQAVTRFAASEGLTVTDVSANHTIVHVTGPASTVENAFSVHLWNYARGNQPTFYAPSNDPALPSDIASKVIGVVGLDNVKVYHPHILRRNPIAESSLVAPLIGNGPNGSGLTPADIKNAYNLTGATVNDQQGGTNLDGTGQTMGLLELDNYTASDITGYETQYGLPNVPLQNVLVDGGFGTPAGNTDEVTLDIELQMALAPKVNKILVYESPDTGQGFLDNLARIATDNLANCISVSWGSAEGTAVDPVFTAESQSFQQMETQGQSIFVSSGDSGAFTDTGLPTTPVVDDPANNPDVTGVGGTKLFVNGDGSYNHETTWNEIASGNGAGGGGVSQFVPIPDYQTPVVTASTDTELSKSNRNVPDVSLDADPLTPYSIFLGGKWQGFAGTSAAAPLWAAFTALVNQQRQANGGANIGFINPSLYAIAQLPVNYAADFHDIADNSTNGFYHAEAGLDDATGLGTFNGQSLLFDPNLSIALSCTITGTVTTSGSTPVPNAEIVESLVSTGQVVKTATTDDTGAYTIPAPANLEVRLDAKSEGLFEQAPIVADITSSGTTLANQDFTMLVSPHTFLNDGTTLGIQMVSSPFTYQTGLSMATILGASDLKAAVWDPSLGQLNDYVVAPLAPADTFRLGLGYWISVPETDGFYSISQPGSLSVAGTTVLNLSAGWNMIGDPYDATIAVSGITASINGGAVEPYSTAEANNSLSIFYTWQAGDTAYETINGNGSLQPWEGYWIFAKFPSTITVPGPT